MIVVTGSTGQIGSALVTRLLDSGAHVRAVVQPGVETPWADDVHLEVVFTDFSDADGMRAAAKGADAFFLMSPPHEHQVLWQDIQVDAARAANVGRVVKLSAFDTAADTPLTMGRWHWAGEESLRASGLPYSVLRPQYFMENLLHAVDRIHEGMMPTFIEAERPVGMVAAADVADVAAALLTQVEPIGQVVVPTGPSAITTTDVAAALSTALGRPVEPAYAGGEQALSQLRATGRPEWHARDVLVMCRDASALVTTDVPDLTGHPARDIHEVVAGRFAVNGRSETHATGK